MKKNEIKKALYKEKPEADLFRIDKSGIEYTSVLQNKLMVFFLIPFSDIGDGKFYKKMESQLLIRWMK